MNNNNNMEQAKVILRFFQILSYVFHYLFLLRVNRFILSKEAYDKKMPKYINQLFETLGPSFLKIGQILGTRHDLFSEKYLTPLKQLQDSVRPFSKAITEEILIEHQLYFVEFDYTPIASGSVAQVHKATLENGDIVAVKIQRPDIESIIKRDLASLILLSKYLKKIKALNKLPLGEIFNQIGKSLIQQTDFELEADANQVFTALFADTDSIRLPRIYKHLSSKKILVMEYFEGLKRFDDPSIEDAQFYRMTELALHVLYKMVFTKGTIHCDLHPANLCISTEGNLIILDTGFISQFSPDKLLQYRAFFVGIVFNTGKKCAKILVETATVVHPDFDYAAFEKDIIEHINEYSELSAGDFRVTEFAFHLFEIQRKHGLYASSEFIMAIISMLVVEGIIKHRLPDLDFQSLAIPYLDIKKTKVDNV